MRGPFLDAVEVIEAALAADADLELEPPASPAEIAEIEAEVGVPLPGELRALLGRTGAIAGSLAADVIDFTGGGEGTDFLGMFPHPLEIAGDGYGNFWVVDLLPGAHDRAAVFFACHDPPVLLFQSASIAEFLHEAFRMPGESLVDDVHDDRPFDVWRKDPFGVDRAAATGAGGELAAFAESLDGEFRFYDLRDPRPGMGFPWGRGRGEPNVVRHGTERIWAVEQREKRGLLGRLRG